MAENDPFGSQPSAGRTVEDRPLAAFADHLGQGFRSYFARWQDWIAPVLLSAAVFLAAAFCCYFPLLLVVGPLTCGLHACGLRTLRGQRVDAHALWHGWEVTLRAILVWLVVGLLRVVPMLLMYGLIFAVFILVSPVFVAAMSQAEAANAPNQEPVLPLLLMFASMFVLFGVAIVGGIAAWCWTLWLNTRTMFIMPLIVDRRVSFGTAWTMSWQETRRGFWVLLLLNFLASLIGSLGVYACYVGLIFTLPLYFTIVDAAYEHRFTLPG